MQDTGLTPRNGLANPRLQPLPSEEDCNMNEIPPHFVLMSTIGFVNLG